MKSKLSTLWIVVLVNMIFADILSFMVPGALQAMMSGDIGGGIKVNQSLLLIFAIVNEIPIAMIFLSRILKYKANRIISTVAAVITTAYIIGGGSAYLHYYFFAAVQIACMIAITVLAWKAPVNEAYSEKEIGK